MHDPYRPHEALVAPARPSSTLVRLVLGVVLTVVLVFSLIFAASALLNALIPIQQWDSVTDTLETGATPVGVLANLYVFGFVIAALAIALRNVHGRRISSLIGNWRLAKLQFGRVCIYLIALHLALSVLLPMNPDIAPTPNMAFASWLAFLPLALPALLIQTGAEELVFRGYMQSQLAARFSNPRIWIIVPSVCFGLMHYDPVINGDNAWLVVFWATAFGLVAADLTARTGTLGPAVAVHFINNFFAIFLAAPADNFDGLALYTFPFGLDDTDIVWLWAPVDLMVLFVSWLTARLALRV
ncbi:MAG: type II CAAX endopeptidase family protein [Pseudomonadota bacterium]